MYGVPHVAGMPMAVSEARAAQSRINGAKGGRPRGTTRKTCKRGHPLQGDNLMTYFHQGRWFRVCVSCAKIRAIRRREKNRLPVPEGLG